jgi:multidrug efflux pump subunit AcrA (membrane-fusion protein)
VDAAGKLDIRNVKTAEQVGTLWVVTDGLSAGEKVVVSSLARLRPGMTVHAVPAESASTASNESQTASPPPSSTGTR